VQAVAQDAMHEVDSQVRANPWTAVGVAAALTAIHSAGNQLLGLISTILDLSKVVKIKTNDKEFSGKLPPVFTTFLDSIDDFGSIDRGGVYSVKHRVDVPTAATRLASITWRWMFFARIVSWMRRGSRSQTSSVP